MDSRHLREAHDAMLDLSAREVRELTGMGLTENGMLCFIMGLRGADAGVAERGIPADRLRPKPACFLADAAKTRYTGCLSVIMDRADVERFYRDRGIADLATVTDEDMDGLRGDGVAPPAPSA